MAKSPTAIETFLGPLVRTALKHPDLEGEVIWANGSGWQAQDDAETLLDAEEIPFYAEGLLQEGFQLQWQILAETSAPKDPVHIRLFCWETGMAPEPAKPEAGLTLIAAATWKG